MRESDNTAVLHQQPDPQIMRMQQIIFGRLALIFILLLASWWWTGSYLHQTIGAFPTGLFLFFLVALALTGTYHVAAWFNGNFARQLKIQFFVDVVLVTWLVRGTGDISSPYISLYIVLICLSGILMGKAETLAIAFASALSFAALAVLTGQS